MIEDQLRDAYAAISTDPAAEQRIITAVTRQPAHRNPHTVLAVTAATTPDAATAAHRRRMRRAAAALSAGMVAAGGVTAALLASHNQPHRTPSAQHHATVTAPHGTPRLGPGCEPPVPTAVDGTDLKPTDLLGSTTRGATRSVSVLLGAAPGVRPLDLELIVGVAGSTAGVGPANQLPPSAALRSENQLASRTFALSATTLPQTLTLPVQIADVGNFPVFYVVRAVTTQGCVSAPGDDKTIGTGMGQIGFLRVLS